MYSLSYSQNCLRLGIFRPLNPIPPGTTKALQCQSAKVLIVVLTMVPFTAGKPMPPKIKTDTALLLASAIFTSTFSSVFEIKIRPALTGKYLMTTIALLLSYLTLVSQIEVIDVVCEDLSSWNASVHGPLRCHFRDLIAKVFADPTLFDVTWRIGPPDLLRKRSIYLCQLFEFHRYNLSSGGVQPIWILFGSNLETSSDLSDRIHSLLEASVFRWEALNMCWHCRVRDELTTVD